MELNQEITHHPTYILSYAEDKLQLSCGSFQRPLIIHYQSEEVDKSPDLPKTAQDLLVQNLAFIEELPLEILVVGTGQNHHWLPAELTEYVNSLDIGLECASTSSACYIYNALLGDSRQVGAIIY